MIELTAYRGDSMSFTIPLTNGTAAFTPGGSYSLIFTAKRSSKDPDTAAVFQKSTATGTITTSTTNAIVTVLYTDTTTEDEPVLYWDIQAQHNSTAAVITAAKGTLTLVRDITRQTTASVPIYTVDPAAGNATPAGSTGSVQINNSGALAADSGLVYTGTGNSGKLTVGGGQINMSTNATASQNVSVGGGNPNLAFSAITTGDYNTSFGTGNLQAVTSGSSNVVMGTTVAPSLTTGYQNFGLGSNTLFNLTFGHSNVAIGHGAGGSLTTGSENILIGKTTGSAVGTDTAQIVIAGTSDGSQSTVIGYDGRLNELPTQTTRFIGNTIIWGDGVVGGQNPTASPNNRTSLVQSASTSAKTITLPNATGKLPVYTDTPAAGQVLTATDASGAATWETIAVQTPALYEDFSKYPDNTVLTLSPASLPDIGNKWQWSRGTTGICPVITGGALRGDTTNGLALFYFGNDVGETIRSISFELEFIAGGSGIGNIGTTYAFHSVPVLNENGQGIPGIATPNMLHFEINQKGLSKMGFNEGTGANFEFMQPMGITQLGDGSTPYSTNIAGGDMLGNGKHIITFSFKGNDCIVTALGSSWLFRHPPAKNVLSFSAIPANGDTFAVGGVTYTWRTTLAAAYNVKIGTTILASAQNAQAAINTAAGAGSLYGTGTAINPLVRSSFAFDTFLGFEARRAGPAGNLITCSENSTATTLVTAGGFLTGGERTPISAMGNIRYWWYETEYNLTAYVGYAALYRVWANAPESYNNIRSESIVAKLMTSGQVTLPQSLTFSSPFVANGTLVANNTADFNGELRRSTYTGFGTKQVVANLETKTSLDLSSAASAVYTAGSLLSMTGRQPALGAVNVYELSGFFANTVDDRRIALNELYGGDIFDSGVLVGATVANKMWTMRVTMQRTGSHFKRYITEFTVSGAATVIQTDIVTSTTTAANINFRTTSVAAGDVQIYTYYSTTFTI